MKNQISCILEGLGNKTEINEKIIINSQGLLDSNAQFNVTFTGNVTAKTTDKKKVPNKDYGKGVSTDSNGDVTINRGSTFKIQAVASDLVYLFLGKETIVINVNKDFANNIMVEEKDLPKDVLKVFKDMEKALKPIKSKFGIYINFSKSNLSPAGQKLLRSLVYHNYYMEELKNGIVAYN